MTTENSINHIRNIGIIAHIDAGKTTTTERILFYSGRTHRLGDVDQGTTVTDWMAQERERGITITAAAITTTWRDSLTGQAAQINLIDTPGHIDFTAEVQRSLRVLDGGVVIFDAVAGVEPQSETVWHQADRFGVPRICFINKLDRVGANIEQALAMMRERLGANPVLIQIPVGVEEGFAGIIDLFQMKAYLFTDELGAKPEIVTIPGNLVEVARRTRDTMIERIAETDEALTAKFLNGDEISTAELYAALRRAVIANRLTPVLLGSALRNKGIQPLLDAVVRYLPSPLDVPPVEGNEPETAQKIIHRADPTEPFCALVFKIVSDPFVGRLAYLRIYSGTLWAGGNVYNAGRQRRERVGRLLQMAANKRQEIEVCQAGDITAVVGLKGSFTGDTLCDPNQPILLETIEFPAPVINIAIEPESNADQDRLTSALAKLVEEDPTFRTGYDPQTGQTIISGMGELHLEIIADRIRREFHVRCKIGRPEVAYRETITKTVRAEGRYVLQTGGHGHYAVVRLELAPTKPGTGFIFENQISGGVIPRQFIPGVEAGIRGAMETGILAGYPIVDVKVTLVDGKFHEVDSSRADFEIAASLAFKEGFRQAEPILLEPIMRVEVTVPHDYLGSIINDFARRRGRVEHMETRDGLLHQLEALIPLGEMLGYATELRSLTSGRGLFSMQLDHYAPTTSQITERILG